MTTRLNDINYDYDNVILFRCGVGFGRGVHVEVAVQPWLR